MRERAWLRPCGRERCHSFVPRCCSQFRSFKAQQQEEGEEDEEVRIKARKIFFRGQNEWFGMHGVCQKSRLADRSLHTAEEMLLGSNFST